MHELSIAQNIVDSACETLKEHFHHLNGESSPRIIKISIEVGAMSGVVKDCLEFVFPEATLNTPLENCLLEIIELPLILQCNSCGKTETQKEIFMLCPHCQSTQVKIVQGKELTIKSMEVH